MDEYIDIYNKEGTPTGKSLLKDVAHREGLFHRTVHIWFYTKQKEILFQKRGSNKETFPNFWDVSVAGHVMAGETLVEAALREIEEEIGLIVSAATLQKIDTRKNINVHPNGIKDCEFQNVFLSPLEVSIDSLKIQEEEVDGLCLLPIDQFEFYTVNRNETFKLVPADYSYYDFVIMSVKKQLSEHD